MFVEKLTGRAGWGYRKGLFEIGYAKNLMVRWLIMMFPMKLPFKEDIPHFQIPSPKRCRTVFPAWQHRPSHGRDGSDLAQGLSTPHSQKKYRLLTPSSHVRSLHKKRPGVRFLPGGGKCLAMDFIDAVFLIKILYKNCKKQVHKGYPLAGPCICN